MQLASGTRLGPYAITALIGVGGMGEVYKATDTRLQRTVAIKVLPQHVAADAAFRQRFEREARAISSLNHPHICTLYDVGNQAGIEFLVMEYLEGETLAQRITRAPLPLAEALRYALDMASALEAAHERGIVHRDFKPANVTITNDGAIKLLDFGIAKVVTGIEENGRQALTAVAAETMRGEVIGTASYMSPEQTRGAPIDKRTDVWAFGCVLFEMLSGRLAFAGPTAPDTVAAILERDPRWASLPSSTPHRVRELLERCLRKDPSRRLRDIADARIELEDAAAQLGGRPRRGTIVALGSTLALAFVMAAVAAFWWPSPAERSEIDPSRWEPITNFSDAATQPALSRDGSLLTFIRGPNTFTTPGQIYVKQLPDGEAVPVTNDDWAKMSPVFSPDGTRIAYTVNGPGERWNTWSVGTLRGTPRRWLANASGLTWVDEAEILFSEVRSGTLQHMGIVTSTETRESTRDVYVPSHVLGMAHRSALSPDGQWVLLVEMDAAGVWLPCRLLPFQGDSAGRTVGPPASRCTQAAWSPDGRTMYFSVDVGDGFHLWRQEFPEGPPRQITSGPTAEEGLAIAPDGASLITSMGFRRRGIWIHDDSGERQLSGEGYAFWPLLSHDGRRITYRRAADVASGLTPTELWMLDLATGRTERVLPGRLVSNYDLSTDDYIVAAVVEPDGASRLWLASLDGLEPPRPIPGAEGSTVRFGANDDIFFYAQSDANTSHLYRIGRDGTGLRRMSAESVVGNVLGGSSPDGRWLSAMALDELSRPVLKALATSGDTAVTFLALSVGGSIGRLRWPRDGRLYLSVQVGEASAFGIGRTYVLPLAVGSMLPDIPAGGFRSEQELTAIPGVVILEHGDIALGSAGTYVYSRETVSRNLYRVPLE
jgi:eukaryotic-like serine/threonine-protein kinase